MRMVSQNAGLRARRFFSVLLVVSAVLAAAPVFAAGRSEQRERTGPIGVYASVAPQAYIVGRIGGNHVTVGVLIGPGQDAHTYDPTPREVERLANAEILFTTGLEYEARIVDTLRRSQSGLEIVDLTAGIELRELEAHYHDPTVPHSHDNEPGDPHIWLGPAEVRVQAQTIRDALSRARPELAGEFSRRYDAFIAEVDALEAEIAELLAPKRGTTILVYHPAFGYFTDHFGIEQLAIEAGGREPSPRLLNVTIEKALAAGVDVIFTQPEYDDVASRAVARAIGARTVEITDLDRDWPALMRRIAEAIAHGR
ncbi:MAG: hypothetical protein EA426_19205 [Spirochaetaceae bacterium]|nr:MAG: hypothetical protein EA426_19205 [Spirochaetaceae bacterium]